jgi:hypothetical protein
MYLLASAFNAFGTLPGWLTVAAVVGAAWAFRRGGGGAAISSLETANRVLTTELEKQRTASEAQKAIAAEQAREIAKLQARTDYATSLATALAPVLEWSTGHEQRAQERHDIQMKSSTDQNAAVLNLLALIAERLGPENDEGVQTSEAKGS